ncbi:MAG: hypothetical protein GXO75_17225 [Calditrichaeota bacterium]|nr:hypothetical protein [Calditrichota bacterium]
MAEPWTEVLEYACDWAGGKSTATSAATEITNSLYVSGFNYEDWGGYPSFGGFNNFNLTKFISELGNSYDVNCLDMGKAVTTFGNAIGCSLGLTTYGHTASGENYIDGPLNCIDPIGLSEPTNNTFSSPLIANDCRSGGFSYHAFSEMTSSNNIWDATLQYDIDSNPDNVTGSNPGCGTITTGYTWKLPVNESESSYILRLIDSWPKWYYYSPTWNRNRNFSVY